jgi:hypothetical protein
MKNKTLMKIADISGWLLLIVLVLYFISGYAMVREYGMNHLMSRHGARELHESLAVLFLLFLSLHVVPYYYVRKKLKRMAIILLVVLILPALGVLAVNKLQDRAKSEVKTSVQMEQQVQQAQQELKPQAKVGRLSEKDKKNAAVRCDGCKKRCLIKQGEEGDCGQVKNVDGKLVPTY